MKSKKPGIVAALPAYLPYSAYFPYAASRSARHAGYVGIQALPTHSMGDLSKLALPVEFVEDAWYMDNDGQKMGLLDHLFFPTFNKCTETYQKLCNQPGAEVIVHFPPNDGKIAHYLEVHNGLWLSPEQILETAEKNKLGIVLDTWHLVEEVSSHHLTLKPDDMESSPHPLGDWQKAVKIMGLHTNVVHVQTRDNEELYNSFAGKETRLTQIIKAIRDTADAPRWVVECTIGIKGINPWKVNNMMAQAHDWLAGIVCT